MDFKGMYDWWNGAAKQNAMTAILSNSPEWDVDEFFQTGALWLDQHRQFAKSANVELFGERALDFGCGIGRMTAALRRHYSAVVGVDISDEMVRQATDFNKDPGVTFQQIHDNSIGFPDSTFDLVYSTIVVQHIPFPINAATVAEFFRLSSDKVMFDAPSHKLSPNDPPPLDGIFLLDRRIVTALAETAGFELSAMREFPATQTRHYQYVFRRQ